LFGQRPAEEIRWIEPEKLFFTQQGISPFMKGRKDTSEDKTCHLLDTVRGFLTSGDISWVILDVLEIEIGRESHCFTCNNRRLACLKMYEQISWQLLQGRDVSSSAWNQTFVMGPYILMPRIKVKCRVWSSRWSTCLHQLECLSSNSLSPDKCWDIEIRDIWQTLEQFSWTVTSCVQRAMTNATDTFYTAWLPLDVLFNRITENRELSRIALHKFKEVYNKYRRQALAEERVRHAVVERIRRSVSRRTAPYP
jgi:hypothetical protein